MFRRLKSKNRKNRNRLIRKAAAAAAADVKKGNETSKGRLATQSRTEPLIRPDKTIVQKDFELKQPVATTVGDKKIKPTDEPYGNPNSTNPFGSNGRGKGGGQGEGDGSGQGNGRGTGAGNGNGSGFGNGDGDGNGNGTGDGNTGNNRVADPTERTASDRTFKRIRRLHLNRNRNIPTKPDRIILRAMSVCA